MIKNNKGAILVVTIVSMMILTIIGYITLQMVSNQNVMDTYDQTKIRVDYAAEGIVNRARGYIDYVIDAKLEQNPPTGAGLIDGFVYGDVGTNGYLYNMVESKGKWEMFNENTIDPDMAAYGFVDKHHPFDNSMYPNVYARVYCEFVNASTDGFTVNNTLQEQTYRIVGIASATVKAAGGSVIVSTVACYFNTMRVDISTTIGGVNGTYIEYRRQLRGWRKS